MEKIKKEKLDYACQLIENVYDEKGDAISVAVQILQILDFGGITAKEFLCYVENGM